MSFFECVQEVLQSTPKAGETWCLVSAEWFTGFRNKSAEPLDNHNLLHNGKLRQNLINGVDYSVIPAKCWDEIAETYSLKFGSQKIERKVVETRDGPKVELYPFRLSIWSTKKGVLHRLGSLTKSRTTTKDEIEESCLELLNKKKALTYRTRDIELLTRHTDDDDWEELSWYDQEDHRVQASNLSPRSQILVKIVSTNTTITETAPKSSHEEWVNSLCAGDKVLYWVNRSRDKGRVLCDILSKDDSKKKFLVRKCNATSHAQDKYVRFSDALGEFKKPGSQEESPQAPSASTARPSSSMTATKGIPMKSFPKYHERKKKRKAKVMTKNVADQRSSSYAENHQKMFSSSETSSPSNFKRKGSRMKQAGKKHANSSKRAQNVLQKGKDAAKSNGFSMQFASQNMRKQHGRQLHCFRDDGSHAGRSALKTTHQTHLGKYVKMAPRVGTPPPLEDHGSQKQALKIPKRMYPRPGVMQGNRGKRKRDEGKENQNQQKRMKYNTHSSNSVLTGCPKYNSNYHQQSQYSRRPQERGEKLKIVPKLRNLGNTCFMNSTLQCLFSTNEFTKYFLTGRFAKDINRDNPLGSKGRLVGAYARLLERIVDQGRHQVVAPSELKHVISQIATRFSGYDQHDSQDLLACLLDGLHEDVNLIKKKPYRETKDSDGRPDPVVAAEAWDNHIARNKSKVVDLFQGQLKSTITCPECDRVSVTFDPLMYLTLPLSENGKETRHILMIDPDCTKAVQIKHCTFRTDTSSVDDLIEQIMPNDPPGFYSLWKMDGQKADLKFNSEVTKLHALKFAKQLALVPKFGDEHRVPIRVAFYQSKSESRSPERVFFCRIWDIPKRISTWDLYLFVSRLLGEYLQIDVPLRDFDLYFKQEKIHPDRERLAHWAKADWNQEMNILFGVNCPGVRQHASQEVLSIPRSSKRRLDLTNCLELFTNEEVLNKDNAWYCRECKKHFCATKKMECWKLPKHLIVGLKRFKKGNYSRVKNCDFVKFPLKNLDLTQWEIGSQDPAIYDLYAVSNHMGGIGGGHYTAWVCKDEEWFNANDCSVTRCNNPQKAIVSSNAYILFYKRKPV